MINPILIDIRKMFNTIFLSTMVWKPFSFSQTKLIINSSRREFPSLPLRFYKESLLHLKKYPF